ncbi:MAG TPA: S53 family peptidase, partial [Bryobacteraceae bacterium]
METSVTRREFGYYLKYSMLHSRWQYFFAGSAFFLFSASSALWAQPVSRAQVRGRVTDARRVTLAGNTRPETAEGADLGPVAGNLTLDHVLLQLRRSPQLESELAKFLDDLHDPASPSFHRWLTAEEFGARFGTAQSDLDAVTAWLGSHGLRVNFVYPGRMTIDLSGNAAQIQDAFHTTIHRYNVSGSVHIANVSDPQIPEALAPVVAGVVSMHDFRPHHMARARRRGAGAEYTFTESRQQVHALVPADLATIYDFNPLFANGVAGKGQTIVVVEDTNLYDNSDWTTFRTAFGLAQYTNGSLNVMQPAASGGQACASPGVNGDDIEAILDAEWASAAAPDAAISVASCADSGMTSGLLIAMQNVVNSSPAPAIMSVSYGQCEAYNGATANAGLNSLFQQAATEGMSVFVASGDEDSASCDAYQTAATHGIGVSAFASSPYVVAVGGTDFADVYNGTSSMYWSTTNSAAYGSALSYIPEIPWNDSCANSLLAKFRGYGATYGTGGFCASSKARLGGYLMVAGGSGGPSGCATGAPATFGVVGGTCQGYPKPSWQSGVDGIPNDGVRGIPDVSMFASDGFAWNHFAIVCFTDKDNGGAPCDGKPSNWVGLGGTSLAAPLMAGVQALINQTVGGAQGNPNPVYYSLAATAPPVFHPVTQGDIDVNCGGIVSCFGYAGTPTFGRAGRVLGTTYGGVLSVSTTSLQPAYAAGS